MAHILSVQSQVAFGHVGNAAVLFPLQTLGHEVWPVPTAILSNHAGYADTGGALVAAGTVSDILDGLAARGVPARCDLLLSGYLGTAATGAAVLAALDRIRLANPAVLYCCDPVIGDADTGVYVDDALRAFFFEAAVPAADLLTPNLFELEILSARSPGGLVGVPADMLLKAARDVIARMRDGARMLVTSAAPMGLPPDRVAMLAVDACDAWRVEMPRLEFTHPPHGAGDLASALFAAALADSGDMSDALAQTANRLFAVLEETARQEGSELALVASRARILDPDRRFDPVHVP